MKVLHVTASMSPHWGGPVSVVQGLTTALTKNGIHCEIVTTKGLRVGNSETPIPNVKTHYFQTEQISRLWTAYSRKLARFLESRADRFDLVHVHELWHYPGYAAFQAAQKHGVPFVITIHGELNAWDLKHKGFRKWLYRQALLNRILHMADALHVLTQSESTRVSELGYSCPVFVAPNGINPDILHSPIDTNGFLARYPELAGKRVLLFLGRLHKKKGLDILARSFAKIVSNFKYTMLLVVGPDDDGTRNRMETILKKADVSGQVVFTGMLTGNDKLAALNHADMFVLSSYSEGFTMATLEAMAAGLPVVISEQCNFPEVAEQEAGFVVPPKEKSVTDAISELLSNESLRIRMGQRGQRLVKELYTWPVIAKSVSDHYREIIERQRLVRD